MQKFINNIVHGDCVDILGQAEEPFADLIFADPPFNIGYQYDKYKDKLKKNKYLSFSRDWIGACVKVLKPGGSFYIAIGDEYAAHLKIIAEDDFGLVMRNWIIWYYTFGQQTKAKFARAHTHILYFVKDPKNFTFNDFAVRVPSDRQLIYNDKRADPRGKLPDDVWNEFPRVCGTFKERQSWHPCQMPESILERMIAVSSNPGDLVLDPFIGSGTTAAAAKKLKRKYTGIDISPQYIEKTIKRLECVSPRIESGLFKGLKPEERDELNRLLKDAGMSNRQLAGDDKLLNIFARQLQVRLNNGKKISPELIATALMESAD